MMWKWLSYSCIYGSTNLLIRCNTSNIHEACQTLYFHFLSLIIGARNKLLPLTERRRFTEQLSLIFFTYIVFIVIHYRAHWDDAGHQAWALHQHWAAHKPETRIWKVKKRKIQNAFPILVILLLVNIIIPGKQISKLPEKENTNFLVNIFI